MTQFYAAKALSPAHPQRLCSLIADKILGDCLARDPAARVKCRAQLAQKEILVFGEIVSLRMPKVQESAAAALAEVGLCLTDYSVKTAFHQRAPEIETQDSSCIAADYACDETSEMLPLAEVLAGKLSRNLSQSGEVMVTVEYDEGGRPLRLEQISLALQRDEKPINQILHSALQSFPPDEDSKIRLTILPNEPQFQVMVSEPLRGKSPDNLERSAALMARYIAKNLVAAKLAKRCQVTLAYAVGADEPIMVTVDSFRTGEICADDCLAEAAKRVFELDKQKIATWIKLCKPKFFEISLGREIGHWERTDKARALRDAVL